MSETHQVRPLDPMRSIKLKLGTLVAVTVAVATTLAVVATEAGWSARLVVPIAVAAGLLITQVLARGMTAPLREMTAAARRMAAGDYRQRVHSDSQDEVGDLTRAFNQMAATLEQVDQNRRDLIANVSHELRTPITALQAVLENLADGVSDPDPATLAAASAQTERLGRLVGDLLDLSRVDEGIAPFEVCDVDVAGLLGDAVEQARVEGLDYSIDVTPPGLSVSADPQRLHQLLANLLDNAARHSPAGATVALRATRSGESVELSVSDQGPGIPEADRERVFERFSTSSAQNSGTGLGLAIARWVTDLHGGRIAVGEHTKAAGATINVELPVQHRHRTEPKERPMSTLTPPAPPAPRPADPSRFTLANLWPDPAKGSPLVLALCVMAGAIGGIILPANELGVGWTLAWGTACAVVFWARPRDSRSWSDGLDAALIVALLSTMVLRDAEWVTALCLVAALMLTLIHVTAARTVIGVIASAASVPLAGLRGLPWLGRSLSGVRGSRPWLPVVKTVLISAALLAVFAALFASADAVFAGWAEAVVPDIDAPDVPDHVLVGGFVAGLTLAASFVSVSQPRVDVVQLPHKLSTKQYEWLAPLLVVIALFALFLLAQATVLFGGHDYLARTTGLTYAEYVHQGFGEMTVATVLTLTVLAWIARKAEADRVRNIAGGVLGVMALVVVISALYRMSLYMDVYGFTRLRLLVSVFEGWLGVVIVVVLVGAGLGARWIVPVAVRLGGAALLGLALMNPDAWIAEHNLDRDTSVVAIDYDYLNQLSADAYPVLAELPADEFACATTFVEDERGGGLLDWNWGRAKALDVQQDRPADASGKALDYEGNCARSG